MNTFYRAEETFNEDTGVATLTVVSARDYDAATYKCVARTKDGRVSCQARLLLGGRCFYIVVLHNITALVKRIPKLWNSDLWGSTASIANFKIHSIDWLNNLFAYFLSSQTLLLNLVVQLWRLYQAQRPSLHGLHLQLMATPTFLATG